MRSACFVLWVTQCACLPGFFPVLDDAERVARFEVPVTGTSTGALAVAEGVLSSCGPLHQQRPCRFAEAPPGVSALLRPMLSMVDSSLPRSLGGEGRTLSGRLWRSCPSPGGDELWRLHADLQLQANGPTLRIEFRDVLNMYHRLGDNPTVLIHGHRRAPRTPEQMHQIAELCLRPFVDWVAAEIEGANRGK